MDYKPMTDAEIEAAGMLKPGEYAAEVKVCSEYTSPNSGKTSLKTIFSVFDGDRTYEVWAFLTPAFPRLWKHAVTACISQEAYEGGHISPDDFTGKQCRVIIRHGEYQGKPKMEIADILKSSGGSLPLHGDSGLPF
jgi:hypothetical protein